MAIDSRHPLYIQRLEDWIVMKDTHAGERAVKDKGDEYLPATSGQRQDGMAAGQAGNAAYNAYRSRASFPDVVRQAIEAMVGVMHHKPPVIELPKSMEPMLEKATLDGESLEILLRRINEQQLITGRLGLLLDVIDGAQIGSTPYIAMYDAESIINWDNGNRQELVRQNLNLVVLNESEFERKQDFEWEFEKKYRVLILGDPGENEPAGVGVYSAGEFTDAMSSFNEAQLMAPSIGGKTLDKIPFIFINAKDIVPDPDAPPALGLAKLALTIYRGEADYRQALFMQGQDTLVVVGGLDGENFRTGANASITLPIGGDAKFIGVESTGLTEMREALENDKAQAQQRGGQLMDSVSRERESGEALKIRVAARTATLNQVALAGAFGLESLLRIAAEWMGANPDEVNVEPNLDFADDELTGKTLIEYATAKSLGAPLSNRSIHRIMKEKDLTQMEYEEELAEIDVEESLIEGNDGDGPVEDDEPVVDESGGGTGA